MDASMGPRESFLDELRRQTEHHLRLLAEESAAIFARFVGGPEAGVVLYRALSRQFGLDSAQQVGALLVDLEAGVLREGPLLLSDLEYRGLVWVNDHYADLLRRSTADELADIVRTLTKAGRAREGDS